MVFAAMLCCRGVWLRILLRRCRWSILILRDSTRSCEFSPQKQSLRLTVVARSCRCMSQRTAKELPYRLLESTTSREALLFWRRMKRR
jgi:hypothetical protein